MSNIESIFSDQISQDADTAKITKKNELGQDEFLKLMLAQLEHQDPFKPMENGEFVAQMAQFSTVAGIENMDKSLGDMSQSFASNQLLQSSTLIGRSALVSSSTATLTDNSGIEAHYKLDESTPSVSYDVYSEAGDLVHHSEGVTQGAGMHKFSWDGLLSNGNRAPAGLYTFAVNYSQGDSNIQTEVFIENKISAVSLVPGENTVRFETEEGNFVSLEDINKLQ